MTPNSFKKLSGLLTQLEQKAVDCYAGPAGRSDPQDARSDIIDLVEAIERNAVKKGRREGRREVKP